MKTEDKFPIGKRGVALMPKQTNFQIFSIISYLCLALFFLTSFCDYVLPSEATTLSSIPWMC
jgi:hypothetical protein